MRKIIISIFLLFISSLLLLSETDTIRQSIDDWFSSQPESGKYIQIKEELYTLFSEAASLSLPLMILFERLQEGAAKNIPAQRLLTALKEEVTRLSEIMKMIKNIDSESYTQKKSYFFSGRENKGNQTNEAENFDILVHQLSIFNRSGISVRSMSSLFSLAVKTEKSKEVMLLILHGLIKIPGLDNLSDEETADLGEALIKSTLTPESYGTLSSIFVKGRTYHLNYSTITQIVIEVLNRGGGLVQIEQELKRRGRKR